MSIKSLVPQRLKNYYHLLQAVLANIWFGFPGKKIKVIGVTGTNGKTTTCQMIARILEEAGYKVSMATTINFKIAEREWTNKTKFTTLSAFAVQKFVRRAVDAGCEYAVLETSSHSLDQYRVWGIPYKVAVITNVTREHLDYHHTMDEYRIAKLRMFRGAETIVVNLDMERPRDYILYSAKNKYVFTKGEADCRSFDCGKLNIIKAEDMKLGVDRSTYKLGGLEYNLHLLGEFNVENALAATCVGLSENVSLETIRAALAKITFVPGRMYFVKNDKGFNVIIDYAVTPDSLEKLYKLINQMKATRPDSKIISVFGSCGDRDRGKRPIMGEIVSGAADYVIVTNEDPYHENPKRIIDEVFVGVIGQKSQSINSKSEISNSKQNIRIEETNCWRIMDRREAIQKALQLAKATDFIVITGKGAEETMAIGDKRLPWNDEKVVLEEIGKM